MDVNPDDSPFFPPELERRIFELAVPRNAVSLALVAKRTYHWMIQIIYHTILMEDALCSHFFLLAIHNPSLFIHTKALCLWGDFTNYALSTILRVCSNLEHLALWNYRGKTIPREVGAFPSLRSLSVNLYSSGKLDETLCHFPFINVTHLDIGGEFHVLKDIESGNFPRLTHLACDACGKLGEQHTLQLKKILENIEVCVMKGELSTYHHGTPIQHPKVVRIVEPEQVESGWLDWVEGRASNIWALGQRELLTKRRIANA
ncbi:hypothetical protein DL96DRAFT_1627465 [Flagelloscypha sp. PMI_526]|nr:hypothetical protein DL96DRAFT_1627465 [Flagelloscypha sp. PMI_526]